MAGILEIVAKVFAYGILAVAIVAIGATLIAGLANNTQLVNTFVPIIYFCIGIFALLAILKQSRKK